MMKQFEYNGIPIVYSDRGEGVTLVFLHGYLESSAIWDSFSAHFPPSYRIIAPDIPGHGGSGTWGSEHSMDDLATAMRLILDREGIDKVSLIGHSMGGYVTMAFADLYRERLRGYALFHSTCFADTEEKKINREREISLVKCGKKNQIVRVNIPKGFANDNLETLSSAVERSRTMAMRCSDDGITALLNGMKHRPDRTHVLKDPGTPVLLVGGEKDNYIPVEVFNSLSALAPHATSLLLKESGHMGFIEEPEAVFEKLMTWMNSL